MPPVSHMTAEGTAPHWQQPIHTGGRASIDLECPRPRRKKEGLGRITCALLRVSTQKLFSCIFCHIPLAKAHFIPKSKDMYGMHSVITFLREENQNIHVNILMTAQRLRSSAYPKVRHLSHIRELAIAGVERPGPSPQLRIILGSNPSLTVFPRG